MFNIKQNFRGKHICDQCDATETSIQTKFTTASFITKTKATYEKQLQVVQKDKSKKRKDSFALTGIHRSSNLNKLNYFHMTSNFSCDIMHDLYEGIVPLELNLIILYCLKKKFFTLDEFNHELLNYNYGPLDHKNKPGRILFGPKNQLKTRMKAAKMTCLVRYLPFIIGKKIAFSDPCWKIFTLLSKIIDYANSSYLNLSNTLELETLVVEHHEKVKKEFPKFSLKKKHHNLIHYPNAIRQLGNLVDYNGLRFEGKHPLAKAAATAAHNTINLPKTISQKFQYNSFFNLYTNNIINKELEIIKNKKKLFNCLSPELQLLIEKDYIISDKDEISYDMEIKIFGQLYYKFLYIVVREDDVVSISWIKDIIFFRNELFFFVQKTKVRNFNPHFCAYFIEHELGQDNLNLLKKENIYHYKPFAACSQSNSNAIFVKPYSHVNLKTSI
jgi:hypothetical protein